MSRNIIGGSGNALIPAGTLLGGTLIGQAPDEFVASPLFSTSVPTTVGAEPNVLPDLYDYFPQVIKDQDSELVDRSDVPLYLWDTTPEWDTETYNWDEVIGPEPILKTTTRVFQLEFESTARRIRDLALLYDVDRVKREFLPYLSSYLGVDMVYTSEKAQRIFLRNIAYTYRKKGTPLSIKNVFKSLGFESSIEEKYQNKYDGSFVSGPDKDVVSSDLVLNEVVGVLTSSAGPYTLDIAHTPIVRGSIRLKIYDTDVNKYRLVVDNGFGGWSNTLSGSVDYKSGHATITLPSAPTTVGTEIKVDYNYLTDSFPDVERRRWTDRFRSSYVSILFSPIRAGVSLTDEVSTRLMSLIGIIKPAHAIISPFIYILPEADTESATDSIPVRSFLFVEPLFTVHYHGYGWDSPTNGSQGTYQRGAEEFIFGSEGYPYVYPFRRDGGFTTTQVPEFPWYGLTTYDETVTDDVSPTTTHFSLTYHYTDPVTYHDTICFTSGSLYGECTVVASGFSPSPHYYEDVTVDPALPVAPQAGDSVTVFDHQGLFRNTLTYRRQDYCSVYFTEDVYSCDGSTKVFTGASLGKSPVKTSSVTLSFVISSVVYTETDDGLGAFSNTSGYIASSSIVYSTGAIDVTLTSNPDNSTYLGCEYTADASYDLGVM
jgi:hypothetical protein